MHISHNANSNEAVPEVAIFGCGNVLLGDDGFGPAVIEQLLGAGLPSSVQALDVGTAIREHLLDYLMLPELRPAVLIVVDAAPQQDGAPGEVRLCTPAELPACKIHDFSLHQFPTVNLLRELQAETGMTVLVLMAHSPAAIDGFGPGLSPAMRAAVDAACRQIEVILAPFTILKATLP